MVLLPESDGDQWIVDNGSDDPDNEQLGYVTLFAIKQNSQLSFYGTVLRIEQLGDGNKLQYATLTLAGTTLSMDDFSKASSVRCPNGKTFRENQREVVPWSEMLRTKNPAEPPTCVPTSNNDCPANQDSNARKHVEIIAEQSHDSHRSHPSRADGPRPSIRSPELLTLDPAKKAAIQALISSSKNPHFPEVWQYISSHPMDGGTDPWATRNAIKGLGGKPATNSKGEVLYQWRLSEAMRRSSVLHWRQLLQLARHQTGKAPAAAAPSAETGEGRWTLAGIPSRYGLRIPSVAFDVRTSTCTMHLRNTHVRHLAVYAEFLPTARQSCRPTGLPACLPPPKT